MSVLALLYTNRKALEKKLVKISFIVMINFICQFGGYFE